MGIGPVVPLRKEWTSDLSSPGPAVRVAAAARGDSGRKPGTNWGFERLVIAVPDPDPFMPGVGHEDEIAIPCQADIHDHPQSVEPAKRWKGAPFTIRENTLDL